MYQLQDGGLGGYSDGNSIPDPYNRVAIFMARTQPGQNSSTAAAMISGSAAVMAAEAEGPVHPSAQVLMDLMDKLADLLIAEVNSTNQTQHNAEIAKLCDDVALAKENLAAKDVRIAAEWAALDVQAQRIQSEAF